MFTAGGWQASLVPPRPLLQLGQEQGVPQLRVLMQGVGEGLCRARRRGGHRQHRRLLQLLRVVVELDAEEGGYDGAHKHRQPCLLRRGGECQKVYGRPKLAKNKLPQGSFICSPSLPGEALPGP